MAESVFKVPKESGINIFCFINPILIKAPVMGTNRPDSIAKTGDSRAIDHLSLTAVILESMFRAV